MTAPLLEIREIHTYYNQSYILQGVTLHVAQGEIVGVLGRNGVGKTTLMRSVIGFTPPRGGQIIFSGRDITKSATETIVRQGVALVPQGRRVFRSLSVSENLAIAAQTRDTERPVWTMAHVFDAFPRLRERQNQRAGTLSGGEQQMLAVGRALISNPRLILLDEPTEGLSPLLVRELQGGVEAAEGRGDDTPAGRAARQLCIGADRPRVFDGKGANRDGNDAGSAALGRRPSSPISWGLIVSGATSASAQWPTNRLRPIGCSQMRLSAS